MRTAAILPVKRFSQAKQRLGVTVADPLRADLTRAMVGDVLSALRRCAALERTIVVTNEEPVASAARYTGALVMPDTAEDGQSAAVALGIARARAEGMERVLCIPGDCPALDPAELEALLRDTPPAAASDGGALGGEGPGDGAPYSGALGGGEPDDGAPGGEEPGEEASDGGASGGGDRTVVIVPDRHGTGTNGLLLSPPHTIVPSFGPGSCQRHRELARAAGARCRLARPASLLLDIDTGEDLAVLRERLAGEHRHAPRTRAVLGLPLAPSRAA